MYAKAIGFMFMQAQMLAEMDEEFGVGELVRESIKEERNKVSLCVYE